MTYIHQLADWPNFTWNADALSEALAALRHKQGKHLGKMEALGFNLQGEAGLAALGREIITSSAIEGENLDSEEVRSSIARQLGMNLGGLNPSSREVDGAVEMMLDATQQFAEPLSAERLFGWHAALFPTGRSGMQRISVGMWRQDEAGPMQVFSGALGRPKVHFRAPAADGLNAEMTRFIDWFNKPSSRDPVLKAALAHLWFLTLHPFDDGNGRIGRVIAEMALARGDGSAQRFYSMSSGIAAERKAYYLQLEFTQRGSLDITSWLAWFLVCLDRVLDASDETLGFVLRKARLWQVANQNPVNERQRKVISRMLEQGWVGYLNTSKYARLAKCSTDTALRDIKGLSERGLLAKNPGGGRSTSYYLVVPERV